MYGCSVKEDERSHFKFRYTRRTAVSAAGCVGVVLRVYAHLLQALTFAAANKNEIFLCWWHAVFCNFHLPAVPKLYDFWLTSGQWSAARALTYVRMKYTLSWRHVRLPPGSTWELRSSGVECVWNVMAHAQKPYFVFLRNGRVNLNLRGRQFSRLLAAEVCASAVVMVIMLQTPCSEVLWRVLASHSIRQFPFHFPSCSSPCAITFQLDSINKHSRHRKTDSTDAEACMLRLPQNKKYSMGIDPDVFVPKSLLTTSR